MDVWTGVTIVVLNDAKAAVGVTFFTVSNHGCCLHIWIEATIVITVTKKVQLAVPSGKRRTSPFSILKPIRLRYIQPFITRKHGSSQAYMEFDFWVISVFNIGTSGLPSNARGADKPSRWSNRPSVWWMEPFCPLSLSFLSYYSTTEIEEEVAVNDGSKAT